MFNYIAGVGNLQEWLESLNDGRTTPTDEAPHQLIYPPSPSVLARKTIGATIKPAPQRLPRFRDFLREFDSFIMLSG